jgi:propionate catabolism operon transcriptional regulator
LNQEQQRNLLFLIGQGRFVSIFALSSHPDELAATEALDKQLYEALTQQVVVLPPLRRRKEDLEQMIRMYLGMYNEKYGKQIVGFRPTVLKALMNHPWPRNAAQLEETIEYFIQQTDGEYIDEKVLVYLINNALMKSNVHDDQLFSGLVPLNLNQTLAETERDIINYILEAEQMNQSRAAKRLGISRSTLWRKLNEPRAES